MQNNKSLANLEGLPEEVRKEIISDGSKYSSERVPMAPTIGISSDDETVGQFYIDYSEEQGGRQLLGKELDVVVMKEKKTFSYYNDVTKKLEMFSNEMDVANGKVPYLHPVILKDNDGQIIFDGTYEQFMAAKKEQWIDESNKNKDYVKSLLKQKTLLYVYVPSQKEIGNGIARLFVNLSSSVGLDPAGGYLFQDPEPLSLEHLRNSKVGVAPYTYITRLSNIRGAGSIPWRQIKFQFLNDVPSDKIVEMFNIKREVEKYCDTMNAIFGTSKLAMSDNTPGTINQTERKVLADRADKELPVIQTDEYNNDQSGLENVDLGPDGPDAGNINFANAKDDGFDVSQIPF